MEVGQSQNFVMLRTSRASRRPERKTHFEFGISNIRSIQKLSFMKRKEDERVSWSAFFLNVVWIELLALATHTQKIQESQDWQQLQVDLSNDFLFIQFIEF